MHTLTTDRSFHRNGESRCDEGPQPTTLVAVEALLLWPCGVRTTHPTREETNWPIFAVVLAEPAAPIPDAVCPLFALLDGPTGRNRVTMVSSRCRWTVLDGRRTLLKLSVRAHAPVSFEADILLSARPLLGLPIHGATLALTIRQRADRITDGIDFQGALRELVLLTDTLPDDLITGRRQATA